MDKSVNSEISFKELILKTQEWLVYLLQNIKIIIVLASLGAAIGLLYSFSKEPVYVATLSFGLEDDKGGGGSNLASQFGLDIGSKTGGLFNGENLLILFKSRAMIEKSLLSPVIYKNKSISLFELYIINHKLRKVWNKNPKFKSLYFSPNEDRTKFSRSKDSILGEVAKSIAGGALKVEQKEKKSSIVDLEFKSDNELFSKIFIENLVKVVSDYYIETKSKKAKINLDILQRQTDSIRGVLNGNIVGVAVANDNTFALNPAMNVKRVPSAKKNVDLQANSAILSELIKQCESAKVSLRKETPLIQIIDAPILPLLKERFGKLKGIILGSILSGFLAILFLFLKKIISDIKLND